jgi:hypothetical protein
LDGKFNRRVKVKIIRKFFAGVIVGAMCSLGITLNAMAADITVVHPGINVFGDGTKGSGYFISDSVEYLSTGTSVGTLTTVAVNGSETVIIEADVVGQAGTSTERVVYKIVSAFDRDGTAGVVNVGSNTTLLMARKTGMTGDAVYFTPETTNNTVHINVASSVEKKVQWVGTVKYLKVATTGGE